MEISSIIVDIAAEVIAKQLNISQKNVRKILDSKKNQLETEQEIIDSFEEILQKLSESQESMSHVLQAMDKQKTMYEKRAEQAKIYENIIEMNKEEVDAVNKLLEGTVQKEGKKSSKENIIWGAIFCVLSAIIGFTLGKFF